MKNNFLTRKEAIVLTTINLIYERGVSNVSMKDISAREGVTDASLYKHFKNKEELILAVLDYYEQYDAYICNTLEVDAENTPEKLIKYFHIYSEYYSNYKEITALIGSSDVFLHDEKFSAKEKERRIRQIDFLTELVKEGQEKGQLKVHFEPENLSYILLGSFERIIMMWQLKEYEFSLIDKVKDIIGDVLKMYTLSK